MRCQSCGLENVEGSRFCVRCGKEITGGSQGTSHCPSCGSKTSPGATFCSNCGKPIGTQAPAGGTTWSPEPPRPQGSQGGGTYAGQFTSKIAMDIILTIITCGIYMWFWQYRQMNALNYLLGEEKFKFWTWFLLTLVTCGLYHIYYEYVMSQSLQEVQRRRGRQVSNELPVLSIVLCIFGLSIIIDAIQQNEINKIFDA